MCLRIKEKFESLKSLNDYFNSPLVAEKDITVYKVLIRPKRKFLFRLSAKSPYQGFKYIKGKRYTSILNMDYDYPSASTLTLNIEDGLHSWKSDTVEQCLSLLRMESDSKSFIAEMIIPKGAKYFIGANNDIVSDKLIWPSVFRSIVNKLKNKLKCA